METIRAGLTEITITPELGGTVTSWEVGGKSVLFPETLVSVGSVFKRRGGMPVLFPQAGPLLAQPSGWNLPQHGFARDLRWEITGKGQDYIAMAVASDDATRAQFPFEFKLLATVHAKERGLEYELEIENLSQEPMTIAPGLHPYFYVPVSEKKLLKTTIPEFDPELFDWNDTLVFPSLPEAVITLPQGGTVHMRAGKPFTKMIVWSEPDRDQVCVEPWVGSPGAIANPAEALVIAPGKSAKLSLILEYSD